MNSISIYFIWMLLATAYASFSLNDDEILVEVKNSCPPLSMCCPKAEYAFTAHTHQWNNNAVLSSAPIKELKAGEVKPQNLKKFFRDNFCCTKGPCMEACGIYIGEETELVKGFPENAQQILSLGLPELEQFQKPIQKYIEKYGFQRQDEYQAEIEEYFDIITKYNEKIEKLLSNRVSQ